MKGPIVVHPCPLLSRAEEAKLQISAASEVYHQLAADAHTEGMFFEGQSARLEMLAEGLDDEDLIAVRDRFVAEGVFEVVTGMNATGGDA